MGQFYDDKELDDTLETLRDRVKAIWTIHTSKEIWNKLHSSTQTQLITSGITERIKEYRYAVASLAQAIEKEINLTFYEPFKDILLQQPTWEELQKKYKDDEKKMKALSHHSTMLANLLPKKTGSSLPTPPTLGVYPYILPYIAKGSINPEIDEDIDWFKSVKKGLSGDNTEETEKIIQKILKILNTEYSSGTKDYPLNAIRNKASHPQKEGEDTLDFEKALKFSFKLISRDQDKLFSLILSLRENTETNNTLNGDKE